MNRVLISLHVLLTTPIPVPWSLLIRGAVIVLAYTLARPIAPLIGIDAVNFAALAGLITTVFRNLESTLMKQEIDPSVDAMFVGSFVAITIGASAVLLYVPAALLPYVMSAGVATMGAIYSAVLLWDRPLLDRMGWTVEHWGVEGQANYVRWMILRCFGLAAATAYAAAYGTRPEWIVAHAALPIAFYALFYWTIIATHPYEDDA
ncbi:hypothetical protein BDE40_0076 [Litoreibacter halocynthiae]|uniref:Intracellular septation protein A n=1 Tax=Litoreibacter halocynthiae TaxID=1242689 RepID=A0A4R7LMC9_9RHOB|nr:hypothetical protein [Litoreibacter halocynthiae]TDT76804.1 hypothetical protein BDE40_0076 [Litoreibacter halocynthiae]